MYVCFLLTQHEEEPAQSVGASKDKPVEKLSKSAQKNKKKKENRQKAAREEVSVPALAFNHSRDGGGGAQVNM